MTNVAFEGTSVTVKFPSKSVMAPMEDPLTMTLAPMTGSPEASTTLPDTLLCAMAAVEQIASKPMKSRRCSQRYRFSKFFSLVFFIRFSYLVSYYVIDFWVQR